MSTIKVKPWAEGQGAYVLIDALAFDPAVHERLEGDDTPLPGPFDQIGRIELIELVLTAIREDMAGTSDEELRRALTERKAMMAEKEREEAEQRAAVAEPLVAEPVAAPVEAAPVEEVRNPLDRDGVDGPGGDLPDGYELHEDGAQVVEVATGRAWPNADDFRAWRSERQELLAELSLLDVAFEGHPENAELAELLAAAKAKAEDGERDETEQDGPVEIPADWRDLHHMQRIKLAKELKADAGYINAAAANEIIDAEVAARAATAQG